MMRIVPMQPFQRLPPMADTFKMRLTIRWIVLPAMLLMGHAAYAQITDKEIEIQSALIDAQRESLIGRPEKALETWNQLARKYPANDAVAYGYAQILAAQDDIPAALREINRARKLDPVNTWYPVIQATYLERAGDFRQAALSYEALTKLEPKNEQHYFQWAFMLIKDGRPEEAIAVYNQAERIIGYSQELSRKKYMLFRGMSLIQEAADVLKEVLKRQPDNVEVMYLLAELYGENGAIFDAIIWYEKILASHPGETEAQLALVKLRHMGGDESQTLLQVEKIFSDPAADLDIKIQSLIPHLQEYTLTLDPSLGDQLNRLASQLDLAHPNDPKVASIIADLAFYKGDMANAIIAYHKATRGPQQVYTVWEQLLSAYSASYRFGEQEQYAQKALDRFPNQAKLYYYLAEAQIELLRHQEALESIRTGRLMARKDGYLLYHFAILEGWAHSIGKDFIKADQAFDQAAKLNARGPELLARRSLVQPDPQTACKIAGEAMALDSKLPTARFAQARCAFLGKDHPKAISILTELLQRPYHHFSWLELLGDAYVLSGDVDKALEVWKYALDAGSQSAILRQKIDSKKYIE